MIKIEEDYEVLRDYYFEGMHVIAGRRIVSEEERKKNLKQVCDSIYYYQKHLDKKKA